MIAAPSPMRCMGLRGIRDNAPVKLTCAFTHCRTLSPGSSSLCPGKIKRPLMRPLNFSGGDTGTRTLDPMIKSHLLYQLSYVPKNGT